MMRAALVKSRPLVASSFRPTRTVAWQLAPRSRFIHSSQSFLADEKPVVIPSGAPQTPQNVTATSPVAPVSFTNPTSGTAIPASNVPMAPPTPEEVQSKTPEAPAKLPPPPKKKGGRFRRFLMFLISAGIISYAGGVYYALVSDNFHDFFTEYVPYGEEAVLFFEEQEYRRRFPSQGSTHHKLYPQTSGENKQTFSGRSGISAKVADENQTSDLGSKGRHSSATGNSDSLGKTDRAVSSPATSEKTTKAADDKGAAKKSASAQSTAPASKVVTIDPLNIDNAADPAVHDMTKILNDVITVINADNSGSKYGAALNKAKDSLKSLAANMAEYRSTESKAAEEKIRKSQIEFDNGAQELIKRIQQEQTDQELRFREEYEAERERLARTYQEKLKAEADAAEKVAEQRLQNQLIEQSVKLQDEFAKSVRDRVESERSSRLSKLNELSSSVEDLEKLTAKWSDVLDANLKTQHLVVAVESVRSILESNERPKPFVHELAALKEIAGDDSVVNAAIASIKPAAYQRGMPTPAQLIDRFRRVATEVRKASLLPEDAGAASHAASFVLSKVMFKKQGLAVGEDVESVLTRAETYLEEGNLDEAAREMNGLSGWAKVLSKDWLQECRTVLEVKQALEVMSTEARLQSLMVE